MEAALDTRGPDRTQAVALKAYANVAAAWHVSQAEAAALADMTDSTWKRAKKPGYAGDLTHDQVLRLSGLIGLYKALHLYFNPDLADRWVTMPNRGPLFEGARPVDTMIAGGLPEILQVRGYVDALRGGV